MYLGLDLTSSDIKPSGCALLDQLGRVQLVRLLTSDAEMLDLIRKERPIITAIDAPLFFPKGWDCLDWPCATGVCPPPPWSLRIAERKLYSQGISLYATTKRSFIKTMIRRAIQLKESIEPLGIQVIEIYPYASKVRLFGKPMPKKTKPEGRKWLRDKLDELIPGLSQYGPLNHDQLDALVAAYTACLYGQGHGDEIGERDEGIIVLPCQ